MGGKRVRRLDHTDTWLGLAAGIMVKDKVRTFSKGDGMIELIW